MPKYAPATQLLRQRTGLTNARYATISGRHPGMVSAIMWGRNAWSDWLEQSLLEATGDAELVAEAKELQRQTRRDYLEAQLAKLEDAS